MMEQNISKCGLISNRHDWKYPTNYHRVCGKCGDMQVLKSDNLNTYFNDIEDFEAFVHSIIQYQEAQKKQEIAVHEGRARALAWLKRAHLHESTTPK
jgi:phage terminase large subunit GpA-like protein